jgi:hypothetical protein
MFFKKLLLLGAKKESLVHTASTYRLYDTTHNDMRATKIALDSSVAPYEFLKKIKHDNLIRPIKIDARKNTLLTARLYPFRQLYRREMVEFNKYCLYKIALAVRFLHHQCRTAHNNIGLDSLFMDEDGRIVLGGFEKSRRSSLFDEDLMMLSNLVSEAVGIDMSMHRFIESRGLCTELFFDLEVAFFGYRSFSTEQKLGLISALDANRSEMIDLYRRRISFMVYGDLSRDVPKDFKLLVVQFIIDFDVRDFGELLVPLFSVLDSCVRLYLLRNSARYICRVSTLDPVADSLSLGLKCKEIEIKEETILFISRNLRLLSSKALQQMVEVMHEYISDDVGVVLVLDFLTSARPTFRDSDVVYRMLCKYLLQSGCKLEVLGAIEALHPTMDTYRLGTELLPLLCGYLSDARLQPAVFALLEKILWHLKEHRGEMISKEWRLRGLAELFSSKLKEAGNEQVYGAGSNGDNKGENELDSKESNSGWDDEW